MARNGAPSSPTLTAFVLNLAGAAVLALAAILLGAFAVALQHGLPIGEHTDTLLLLQLLRARMPLLFLCSGLFAVAATWAILHAYAASRGRRSGVWSAQRKAVAASVLGVLLVGHHAFAETGTAEGLVGGMLLGVVGLLAFCVMACARVEEGAPRRPAARHAGGASLALLRPGWRAPPTRFGATAGAGRAPR